jgi:hypothetical protein
MTEQKRQAKRKRSQDRQTLTLTQKLAQIGKASKAKDNKVSYTRTDLRSNRRRIRSTVAMPVVPPVMVREPNPYAPSVSTSHARKKKASRTKRRYDFALNMPGVEISLPALPQIHIGWRGISFFLAVFLAAVLYFFWTSPIFRVSDPIITGLKRVKPNHLTSFLGIDEKVIFDMNAIEMEKKIIEAYPEILSASVIVDFPSTVAITVTERVPILVWQQEQSSVLVDQDGITFPIREDMLLTSYPKVIAKGAPPEIPEQTDDSSELDLAGLDVFTIGEAANRLDFSIEDKAKKFLSVEMVEAILLLSNRAPIEAELIYDPTIGLGWKDQRGWDVYFGEIEDIEMKLNMYEAILEHLKAENTHPSMINVALVHSPYYRLEE